MLGFQGYFLRTVPSHGMCFNSCDPGPHQPCSRTVPFPSDGCLIYHVTTREKTELTPHKQAAYFPKRLQENNTVLGKNSHMELWCWCLERSFWYYSYINYSILTDFHCWPQLSEIYMNLKVWCCQPQER